MLDLDLADTEPSAGGQHRNETVQFTVEPHLAKHLGAIALHPAIMVVQTDPGYPADQPVEDPAGADLVPGIVAGALPTADHVAAGVQGRQETRNLVRIVLQVGVHRKDDVAAGRAEASREGRRLAEVPAKAQAMDIRM